MKKLFISLLSCCLLSGLVACEKGTSSSLFSETSNYYSSDDSNSNHEGTPYIKLYEPTETIYVNDIISLTYESQFIDVNSIIWTSSDSSIASIDQNGVLTAIKKGKVTITVSSGAYNDSIVINIVDNENYTDGLSFTLNNGEYVVSKYNGNSTSVYIPKYYNGLPVTSISTGAFTNCLSIFEVYIPNSVTTIESLAFSNCLYLCMVNIPISVTLIGHYAFDRCTSLTLYCEAKSMPSTWYVDWNGTTKIKTVWNVYQNICSNYNGFLYFARYDKEKETPYLVIDRYVGTENNLIIPSSINIDGEDIPVREIGDNAFSNCDSVKSVVIPDSVTTIGFEAFSYIETIYCEALSKPDGWDDNWCYYGAQVIWGYLGIHQKYDDFEYAVCKDENSDLYITIYNGTNSEVVIPSSINIDGEDIPVREICNNAFSNCSSLESVVISDSVTSIGDNAFYCCFSLESVVISDSVTSIGNYAFYDCYSLESVVIPNSVTSIGNNAFASCSSLESVVISDSVTSIGDNVFDSCYSLESVIIPDSVTSIGDNAFDFCYSLESVIIPDSVTSIGYRAFYGCSSLESVVISDSVTTIGYTAFYGIETIYCEAISKPDGWDDNWCDDDSQVIWGYAGIHQKYDDFEYAVCKDENSDLYITIYNGTNSEVVIPSSINIDGEDIPVREIGYRAFSNCSSLESVVIPNSVTSIGDNVFDSCYFLESVIIPDSVTSIGYRAFYGCYSLESVVIPDSVTTIGYNAFYGIETIYCEALSKPDGWDDNWCDDDAQVIWGYKG